MIQELKTTVYALAALLAGLALLAMLCVPAYRPFLRGRLVPAMICTQVVAFLSPSLWAFHILAAAAVPLLARQRGLIAPLYLFLLLTLPGVERELRVGGAALFTAGLGPSLGLGAAIAMMLHRSPPGQRLSSPDVLFGAFWLFTVCVAARDTNLINYARVAAEQAVMLILPYLIISRTVRTSADIKYAVFGLLAATMALASLAIFEALRSWPIYSAVYQHYGISRGIGDAAKMRAGFLRSPGPFAESTSFGLFLALGFLAMFGGRRFFNSRAHWLLGLMLPAIGLLAPQSRGAWVGAIVGVMMLTWYRRDWGGFVKQAVAATVLAGGAIAVGFMSSGFGNILENYGNLDVKTDYRAILLQRGMEEFWKNPVVGLPSISVYRALEDMRQGEQIVDFVNTYLYVALVSGGIGLAIFVTILLAPLIWLFSKVLRTRGREGNFADSFFAMQSGLLVMLAFTSQTSKTTAMLVFLIAISSRIRSLGVIPGKPPSVDRARLSADRASHLPVAPRQPPSA